MAEKGIDFQGARFEQRGRSWTELADGTRLNETLHRQIILADGTEYHFDQFGWKRWQVNKNYRSFPDSRGHFRKCNDRYTSLLNQAFKEHFKEDKTDAP